MQSISPIRDIIHDYISPSVFEAEVIDSRYFQRLHFVWQNSAAFTVYPCNKNSRFVHSLGVSHLCGRILIHSLRNSDQEVFKNFLILADKFVDSFVATVGQAELSSELLSSWKTAVGNRSRFRHNELSIADIREWMQKPSDDLPPQISNDPEFTINTLWIALKIAALCHDVGHLPMSHEFEKAIEYLSDTASMFSPKSPDEIKSFEGSLKSLAPSDWRYCFATKGAIKPASTLSIYSNLLGVPDGDLQKYLTGMPLHERRSLRIVDEIRTNSGSEITKQFPLYRQLLFKIATAILLYKRGKLEAPIVQGEAEKSQMVFLRALKDILASELDADRLDYVARDPKASGLETGVFDINRIVNSFVLDESEGQFVAVPSVRALTAIEAFFHQRYLNYKSLIYHKSALRSKSVLRQAVMRIIAFSVKCPANIIAKLCIRSGILSIDSSDEIKEVLPFNEINLEQFDDTRLRSLFFDTLNAIKDGTAVP